MKKQVSTLSLIALAAFSIWQYFTEHKKDTKPAPTTTQQQSQSAIKNTTNFGNYDVIMRDDAIGQNKNAPVDYYMLALSWSPAFCEKQRAQYGNNLPDSAQYQCSTKNQFGWVVHGELYRMHPLRRHRKVRHIFYRTLVLLLCGCWSRFSVFFVFSEILPNAKCGKGNKGKSGNLFFHKNPV